MGPRGEEEKKSPPHSEIQPLFQDRPVLSLVITVTKPISILWKSPIDFHIIPSVIYSSKGHLKRLRTKFMIRLTACWLGQICNQYEVKKNCYLYFRWRKHEPPQLSRKNSYYRLNKGTSTQIGNVHNFLFTNMPEQNWDQRSILVYGYQSLKLTPTTKPSLTRCILQSGPKKWIHSLLINIFGINLNEISTSGRECNITPTLNPKFKDISHINFAFV